MKELIREKSSTGPSTQLRIQLKCFNKFGAVSQSLIRKKGKFDRQMYSLTAGPIWSVDQFFVSTPGPGKTCLFVARQDK